MGGTEEPLDVRCARLSNHLELQRRQLAEAYPQHRVAIERKISALQGRLADIRRRYEERTREP